MRHRVTVEALAEPVTTANPCWIASISKQFAAGQPYETFLREQFLEPAGMLRAGFWEPENHPEVADILYGELTDSSILRPNWGFRGGVGMFSTTEDLYLWYQALDGAEVLSAEDLADLTFPPR